MKVLIAEDHAVSRRILSVLLEKLGYEVLVAANGREAWDLFQRENVSLVLTDWMMPGMDGPTLCRMIREEKRRKYTYIILLTVLTGKGSNLEAMTAGADDFLTKPHDPELLAARLRVAERILGLQDEVNRLQGLLPICQYCKKIRDDGNQWTQIEAYISKHTEADFSHGICPECVETRVKPQLAELRQKSA